MRDHREASAGVSKLARRVIASALNDLGSSDDGSDRVKVLDWIESEEFRLMCDASGWDDDWVIDVFRGVDEIQGASREPIAKQCVHMLKSLANSGGVG